MVVTLESYHFDPQALQVRNKVEKNTKGVGDTKEWVHDEIVVQENVSRDPINTISNGEGCREMQK